jgi:hypothetical protein
MSEWIAFADRRPDDGAYVIAYRADLSLPMMARFSTGDPFYGPDDDGAADAYEWIDPQGDGYGFPGTFTHWLPLPAPPIVAAP